MKYVIDSNGNPSKVSDAVSTDMRKVPEPPEDASVRGGGVEYQFDRELEKWVKVERDNRSVYQKILDKFQEWEGGQSAALDRMDTILSSSPTLKIAVDEDNVKVVKDRLQKHQGNALKPSEVDELIALIE